MNQPRGQMRCGPQKLRLHAESTYPSRETILKAPGLVL
jgi:hypothetical protein